MLTYEEYKVKQRDFKQPCVASRCTGKTFRALNEAAMRVSVGDRVVVFSGTHFMARDMCRQFLDTYRRWSFRQTAPMMVRQRYNNGFVLFRGIGKDYNEYTQCVRGNNVYPIYDV
ncbi:hypothetical protein HOR19_gp27 [Phage MedPE-SWcel-C56]|uniref:Uncharacterized protein n=1 Tax=Phage MedPE-SWcel-C56 TaxID=1871314 RepID=A0A1B1IY13_9CAUD|nr:hypothetical protein HOR19_gp27 [Phage MedPE-SWcel-C56]ANS06220.1 hypothetical protein [Phage MedPE-SWcel-C56]